MVAAGATAVLHPTLPPCLHQVDEIIKTIHTQLACVSQEPLRDILKRTLLQVARLHTWEATTSLLVTSLDCDRYVARQPREQLRSSGACPGRRAGGQGGPTDSVLWLCSTARAMWSTLASDQCLVDSVLKVLLMAQQKGPKSYSLNKPCCWCCRFTAVSVRMRPAPPNPGRRATLQPLLPSPPAPQTQTSPRGAWPLVPQPPRAACAARPRRAQAGSLPLPRLSPVLLLPPHRLLPAQQPGSPGQAACLPGQSRLRGQAGGAQGRQQGPGGRLGSSLWTVKAHVPVLQMGSEPQEPLRLGSRPGSRAGLCPGVSLSAAPEPPRPQPWAVPQGCLQRERSLGVFCR